MTRHRLGAFLAVLAFALALPACREPDSLELFVRQDEARDGVYVYTLPLRDTTAAYDFWFYSRTGNHALESLQLNVQWLSPRTLTDLAEGEMLQLEKAGSANTSEEDYLRIIYCKTASLFSVAAETAAISVAATPGQREASRAYGSALGIAFQIKDDILDYAGTDALGKPVGVDLKEQKITLPLLAALEGSPRENEIRAMVRDIPSHPEHCDAIRAFVAERGGIAAASRRLEDWVARAEKALDVFPDGTARQMLVQIARFNLIREV